jgi:hypothetical protein
MEKTIWLTVEGVELRPQGKVEGRSTAWCVVKAGLEAFSFNNILIGLNLNGDIDQFWGLSWTRVYFFPALEGKDDLSAALRTQLEQAVADAYLYTRKDELSAYLKGLQEAPVFEFYYPPDWQGKRLRIPVAFVRLTGFSCPGKGGPLLANIKVGHYLIFLKAKIFDASTRTFGYQDSSIQDQRVISVINGILADNVLQKRLLELSELGIGEYRHHEYIRQAPDYNPEQDLPPLLKLE